MLHILKSQWPFPKIRSSDFVNAGYSPFLDILFFNAGYFPFLNILFFNVSYFLSLPLSFPLPHSIPFVSFFRGEETCPRVWSTSPEDHKWMTLSPVEQWRSVVRTFEKLDTLFPKSITSTMLTSNSLSQNSSINYSITNCCNLSLLDLWTWSSPVRTVSWMYCNSPQNYLIVIIVIVLTYHCSFNS